MICNIYLLWRWPWRQRPRRRRWPAEEPEQPQSGTGRRAERRRSRETTTFKSQILNYEVSWFFSKEGHVMEVGLITVRTKIYENWKFNEYLLMGWSECHTYIVDTSMIYSTEWQFRMCLCYGIMCIVQYPVRCVAVISGYWLNLQKLLLGWGCCVKNDVFAIILGCVGGALI